MKSQMITPPRSQAELAGDLVGGLHVDLESGRLGVVLRAELAAVDVYSHQGLGGLDHQRPAGTQRTPGVQAVEFGLDAVAVEDRHRVGVLVDHIAGARLNICRDYGPAGPRSIISRSSRSRHIQIADSANDQVGLAVELGRSTFLFHPPRDHAPQA